MTLRIIVLNLFALCVLYANEVSGIKNISKELVKIRAEIETLHEQINGKKQSFKEQVRSYAVQKSDLEAKINRDDLRIKELQKDLTKITEKNREKSKSQNRLSPVLKKNISFLKEYLKTSIPFKKEQRLTALREIEGRLDGSIVSPNKAANQLWAFVEDELMLGKESGIYNDKMTIDGENKLVKVVKIGKTALFYKSLDEEYGYVKRSSDKEWKQEKIVDEIAKAEVENLFDMLGKQVRTAKFTLPNIFPKVER